MEFEKIPKHIAIIMDGNGRWAQSRRKLRVYGHVRGSAQVRPIVTECGRLGVKVLTLYAFSEENWGRPSTEVNVLMKLLDKYLIRELKTLMQNNVRLKTIGDTSKLPDWARSRLLDTIEKTKDNTGLTLVFALSYGSRQEIVKAVRNIVMQAERGQLSSSEVTDTLITEHLQTCDLPDPDLIIRTSGEHRLSNFLLWQAAYSEFYFIEKPWPEFGVADLHIAIKTFSSRTRRFGLTDSQLKVSAPEAPL